MQIKITLKKQNKKQNANCVDKHGNKTLVAKQSSFTFYIHVQIWLFGIEVATKFNFVKKIAVIHGVK